MARKTEETSIRGRTFKVTQLPGMRGLKLFYRLAGVVVPALTNLGKGLGLLEGGMGADVAELFKVLPDISNAANVLFEKLPEAEFEKLVRELLETTTVKPLDGSNEQLLLPILDEELAGETGAILQLVGFALKVNYGSFMPGLVAQARSIQATTAESQSKG